ncbi:TonB C-terminal domain-containing protein [Ignatzschineria sp. RMDPL8A]|uniref:TonB C-terminal domain-containing protein n=1 Tax=Ignatzschineria sp. RMDPL8A TaxID=2999236 RepID=UPI0024465FD0|nr:TonB C-terminal domain-containing protein [Ignatzschineria sp. RMDPL8A]MDG9728944.1 TonB C-terminal domain-containing protein [Ignatzschineria sp. RMDPL8A]
MNSRLQSIIANGVSLLLTALMIAGVVFFVMKTKEIIFDAPGGGLQVPLDSEIPTPEPLASERIDHRQVTEEINRLATEKRLEEERIAKEKAEKARQEKIAKEKTEKARQEKIAKEKAEKERQEKIAKEKAEKERQEKIAQEKAEKARQEKIAQEKAAKEKAAKEKAEQERIAKEKAAQAERDRLAKEKAAREQAARDAKILAEKTGAAVSQYLSGTLKVHLYTFWIKPEGGLSATVRFQLNANGYLIGDPQVIKSSGSLEYDRSTVRGIEAAVPIPLPTDPLAIDAVKKERYTFEVTFE